MATRTSKRSNVFISWVNDYGRMQLAKELDIDPSTISHWRRGQCPKVEHMKKLIRLSAGKLSYELIIDGSVV